MLGRIALVCVLPLVLLALPRLVLSAIEADHVLSLPNFAGSFPSAQYSGYIRLGNSSKYLHYWLVLSERNPKTDPLVFWTNGGPGCSSMDGMWYEQGPMHWNFLTNQVVLNPYRWTRVANMVFVEQPVGVGFSYSTDPSDYNTDDNQTADDNLAFLKSFFVSYPEFKSNDLYLSGESYAGIYIPMLAERVVEDQSLTNFRGILVGNGVTKYSFDFGDSGLFKFAYLKEIIDQDTYNVLLSCHNVFNSTSCKDAVSLLSNNMEFTDPYDIHSPCIVHVPWDQASFHRAVVQGESLAPFLQRTAQRQVAKQRPKSLKAGDLKRDAAPADGCDDTIAAQSYFNNDHVQSAIHVRPTLWNMCGGVNYTTHITDVMSIWVNLMKKGYRLLKFSGDVDSVVPYTGTYAWIQSLVSQNVIHPLTDQDWVPWMYASDSNVAGKNVKVEAKKAAKVAKQVGGYITNYALEGSDKVAFTYVTIRDAGHMVPQTQPEAAFHMFSNFINGN